MDKITILNDIQRHDDIMSLPQAISEILRKIEKPDFSADELVAIVLKDPGLTSRILKVANSPFYHRFANVSTVNQAVQVLGVTTLKCLALSMSVFDVSKVDQTSGIEVKKLFAYILSVAACAEKIGKIVGYKATEELFIAGLLHEVGTLYLVRRHPREYRKVMDAAAHLGSIVSAERQVLGIDHMEIAMQLAKRWSLPERICGAIAAHHNLAAADSGDVMTNIMRLAAVISEDASPCPNLTIEDRLTQINRLSKLVGLTGEQIETISGSLLSWLVAAAEYLSVDIGTNEEILIRANTELWKSYMMLDALFKERQELTARLVQEERLAAAIESKNIAIATLSHYVNNAIMAIYGRSQILRQIGARQDWEKLHETLPANLAIIDRGIQRIVAVLAEVRELSPIDNVAFYEKSKAMKIDDRVERRIASMGPEITLPEVERAPTVV